MTSWDPQNDNYSELLKPFSDWVCCYENERPKDRNRTLYCCLLPIEQKELSFSDPCAWDMTLNDGNPSLWNINDTGPVYSRFNNNNGLEPLLIYRDLKGFHENFVDISQEYIHYHNLIPDDETWVSFDESGNKMAFIKYEREKIYFLKKPLREFLYVKQMCLMTFLQETRFYTEEFPEDDYRHSETSEDWAAHIFNSNDPSFGDHVSFSLFCGKKILYPLSHITKEEKYVEFIIGRDKDEKAVYLSCDPDIVHKDNYLQTVFFKPEVLRKYYDHSQYSISYGYLSCGDMWGLIMDNHSNDIVVAYMGDLMHLPYPE